jgi:hypothetical protein
MGGALIPFLVSLQSHERNRLSASLVEVALPRSSDLRHIGGNRRRTEAMPALWHSM